MILSYNNQNRSSYEHNDMGNTVSIASPIMIEPTETLTNGQYSLIGLFLVKWRRQYSISCNGRKNLRLASQNSKNNQRTIMGLMDGSQNGNRPGIINSINDEFTINGTVSKIR